MNLPTISPIKHVALLITLSVACVAVAGCGNKGPLVKSSDLPEAAPAASAVSPASADPVAEPEVTPVAEPGSGTPATLR